MTRWESTPHRLEMRKRMKKVCNHTAQWQQNSAGQETCVTKPAIRQGLTREHPLISHQLDPVSSGQCLEISRTRLPATSYGRRELTLQKALPISWQSVNFKKKYNCKLDRRRLTQNFVFSNYSPVPTAMGWCPKYSINILKNLKCLISRKLNSQLNTVNFH